MSVTHTISQVYTGGGTTPVQATVTATGQGEMNHDTICAGSATTTLTPPIVIDPDSQIQSCAFTASGNCTLMFDAASGTDVTIGLAANIPFIRFASGSNLAGLPVSADTYTLKVQNAASSTISFNGRICL